MHSVGVQVGRPLVGAHLLAPLALLEQFRKLMTVANTRDHPVRHRFQTLHTRVRGTSDDRSVRPRRAAMHRDGSGGKRGG